MFWQQQTRIVLWQGPLFDDMDLVFMHQLIRTPFAQDKFQRQWPENAPRSRLELITCVDLVNAAFGTARTLHLFTIGFHKV